MFVVGLAALATPIAQEAPALARDLAMTAYEARLLLGQGLPAIVLITPEKARALAVLGALRQRGHRALAFDAANVVSSAVMFSPKQFHFEAGAMVAEAPAQERLEYADLVALIAASHKTRIETTTTRTEKSFSPGMAMLTGGLIMNTTRKESTTTRSEARQDVLYLYRRRGQSPWILRESGTHYGGLGEPLAPTERGNFLRTIERLRENAPGVAYDDRLLNRTVPDRIAQVAFRSAGSDQRSEEIHFELGMDLLAYLLTLSLLEPPQS